MTLLDKALLRHEQQYTLMEKLLIGDAHREGNNNVIYNNM